MTIRIDPALEQAPQGFTSSTIKFVAPMPARPVVVVSYDPIWPEIYFGLTLLITDVLHSTLVTVEHVGSTAVPGMDAKPIIDIDITVTDPAAEREYVPALEALGFTLVIRQPTWYGARMLVHDRQEVGVNLHVLPEGCEEVERHRAMRDWLRAPEGADDRERYVQAKRKAAAESCRLGESGREYNARKSGVLREILGRACGAKGMKLEES